MLYRRTKGPLVLAIAPARRGFGYAVFDGMHKVIDWGHYEVKRGTNRQYLTRFCSLITWYSPDMLVLPNLARQRSRRSPRVVKRMLSIQAAAARRKIAIARYTRLEIRAAFAGAEARFRYEIARAIVMQLPELELWLPPKRKIWNAEDPRMSIFDAASLVFTFFHFAQSRP